MISDFNSLWAISFGVNAIFVFFEFQSFLEKKFIGMHSIGADFISRYVIKEDQRFVKTYGWRSLVLGYSLWLGRLKFFSIIGSILSLALIIAGGFNPELAFGVFIIIAIILIQFAPAVLISYFILHYLPKYKLACIGEAINKIIKRNKSNETFIENNLKQYQFLVDYIIHHDQSFALSFQKRKKMSTEDLFEIFNKQDN